MRIKLLDFQKPCLPLILDQLDRNRFSLNASDTGTGKTYLTLAALQELGLPVLAVAPRGLHSMWKEALGVAGIHPLGIVSIEKLRYGSTEWVARRPPGIKGGMPTFRWNADLPPCVLVFDEVHTCSGAESMNAFILAYARNTPHKVIALSATAADSPAKLRALGYHMGLHNFVDFRKWAVEQGCFIDEFNQVRYAPHSLALGRLKELHHRMFPGHGVRMRISEIPGFPENLIDPIVIDDTTPPAWRKEFEAKYPHVYDPTAPVTEEEHQYLEAALESKPEKEISAMVLFLRMRQQAELAKVAYLVEHIRDLVEEKTSVAVFLNFIASIKETEERLGLPFVEITGPVPQSQRDLARDRFQRNEVHVLFATPGAGGVGISLHDLNGRPRVSLISPGFNTVAFKQTLGRIHRAGSLSPARQYLLCMKKTVEENVQRVLKRKVNQLSLLQDGDLAPEL